MKRSHAVIAAGLVAGCIAAAVLTVASATPGAPPQADPRSDYHRPSGLPATAQPPARALVDLGQSLFNDVRLSGDGTMSCASCHQAPLAFTDGQARHMGRNGQPLVRNTPHLWNLAWSETLFWDGRAKTLQDQALGPIQNPLEMAANLDTVVQRLSADEALVKAFAAADPARPQIEPATIAASIAAFEQTLISPKTRFDAWVEGDDTALDADEKAGFDLFNGKAQCASCHSGWRFTDEAFHDIGLPDAGDLGRGKTLNLPAANHAFKTPSLREAVWTAPYMHDGSLPTLDAVIDYYANHVTARPTLSKDMPPVLTLSDTERQQLIAFLTTLSSDTPPRAPTTLPKIEVAPSNGPAPQSVSTLMVGQKDKKFSPSRVTLSAGQSLTIVNDDKRTHNVRIDDPRMPFTSNAQEPGDSVVIPFTQDGEFGVICSIHPAMHLTVTVAPSHSGPVAASSSPVK